MRFARWFVTFVALLLTVGVAAAQENFFGMVCPGHWTMPGGGGNCVCPDGSLANMIGGQVVCPMHQQETQPQQSICPARTTYCASVNLCCGAGNYCSKYGCTPVGAIECGGHYCNPGQQCSRSGGCQPAGAVDCGDYYCKSGERCASGQRACLAQGDTDCGTHTCRSGFYCGSNKSCLADGSNDCGNGTSCAAGSKCSSDGRRCIPSDNAECGSQSCGPGYFCGSNNSCMQTGSTDCGNGGSCASGMKCTSDGHHCMPAENAECGNHSCGPGHFCGSNSTCMQTGANDCGNGISCAAAQRCSRDAKRCLEKEAVDCGSFSCNPGQKCASGHTCINKEAVDCGNGTLCPAGSLCKRGGACITREEYAQQRAEEARLRQENAARSKREAEENRVAVLKRVAEQRETARLKQEEQRRQLAKEKEEADRRRAAAQKEADEKRAAALKEARERVAAAQTRLREEQELARLQKEAQRIAAQTKREQELRRASPNTKISPVPSATDVAASGPQRGSSVVLNTDLRNVSTLQPRAVQGKSGTSGGKIPDASSAPVTCSTFNKNDPSLDKYGCPRPQFQSSQPTKQAPPAQPTKTLYNPFSNPSPAAFAKSQAEEQKRAKDPNLIIGAIPRDTKEDTDCGHFWQVMTNNCITVGSSPRWGKRCMVCTVTNWCDLHQNNRVDTKCKPVKTGCHEICR